MWISVHNKQAVEIDTTVVRELLGIYSEENLIDRPVFKSAFDSDQIELKDLKNESNKILIPWQFFLLDKANFLKELDHINKTRSDKVSAKLIAKRKGIGDVTSKRIIDRLIRLQNFICEDNVKFSKNVFCGSLIGKTDDEVVNYIISYFSIDINKFRGYSTKGKALEYLIQQVESKNINVSQGVLTNKILPTWQVVNNSVYKNTSGFVIKDEKVPFIFLPSEVNPEETDGRQIYTLVYLIVLIGLNEYNFFIERDFKAKAVNAKGQQAKIYRITSKFLLPESNTNNLKTKKITPDIRDNLSSEFKITPTAVVVILRIRKIIQTKEEYEILLPPPYKAPTQKVIRYMPGIDTSVRKFCGKIPFDIINYSITNKSIKNVQAQYLIFGVVNKKGFKKYCSKLNI